MTDIEAAVERMATVIAERALIPKADARQIAYDCLKEPRVRTVIIGSGEMGRRLSNVVQFSGRRDCFR